MAYGIMNTNSFTLGDTDFYIDYQDQSYYGQKANKYYSPSHLNDDCWNIDFTKCFRTEQACKDYITKCVKQVCKKILKEL